MIFENFSVTQLIIFSIFLITIHISFVFGHVIYHSKQIIKNKGLNISYIEKNICYIKSIFESIFNIINDISIK